MGYTIFAPSKERFLEDMARAYERGAIRTWVMDGEPGSPAIITINIIKTHPELSDKDVATLELKGG